jgi:phosphomannomutase
VAGAVISASHNPAPDNGIKFFDHGGVKLPDATEDEIEAAMTGDDGLPRPTEGGIGLVGDSRGLVKEYEDFLVSLAPKLEGLRVVLDCANGATYRVAPSVFAQTGAEVLTLFDMPDGANINAGCGATQPEALQRAVVDRKADIGFAFDGDGDRVMTVDARGAVPRRRLRSRARRSALRAERSARAQAGRRNGHVERRSRSDAGPRWHRPGPDEGRRPLRLGGDATDGRALWR